MKINEIRGKSENELKKNLVEMRNNKAKMRFDISAKQIKNHREARKVKKNIARILTVLKSSAFAKAPSVDKSLAGKSVDKQKA